MPYQLKASLEVVADALLGDFARPEDDALMLVTRYVGGI